MRLLVHCRILEKPTNEVTGGGAQAPPAAAFCRWRCIRSFIAKINPLFTFTRCSVPFRHTGTLDVHWKWLENFSEKQLVVLWLHSVASEMVTHQQVGTVDSYRKLPSVLMQSTFGSVEQGGLPTVHSSTSMSQGDRVVLSFVQPASHRQIQLVSLWSLRGNDMQVPWAHISSLDAPTQSSRWMVQWTPCHCGGHSHLQIVNNHGILRVTSTDNVPKQKYAYSSRE